MTFVKVLQSTTQSYCPKKLTFLKFSESFQTIPKDLQFCIPYIHSKMNGEKLHFQIHVQTLYEAWWSNLSFHLRSLESSKGHKILAPLSYVPKNHRFDPILMILQLRFIDYHLGKEGIDNIACHLTFYPFSLSLNLWSYSCSTTMALNDIFAYIGSTLGQQNRLLFQCQYVSQGV